MLFNVILVKKSILPPTKHFFPTLTAFLPPPLASILPHPIFFLIRSAVKYLTKPLGHVKLFSTEKSFKRGGWGVGYRKGVRHYRKIIERGCDTCWKGVWYLLKDYRKGRGVVEVNMLGTLSLRLRLILRARELWLKYVSLFFFLFIMIHVHVFIHVFIFSFRKQNAGMRGGGEKRVPADYQSIISSIHESSNPLESSRIR